MRVFEEAKVGSQEAIPFEQAVREIQDDRLVVLVVAVGHRRQI